MKFDNLITEKNNYKFFIDKHQLVVSHGKSYIDFSSGESSSFVSLLSHINKISGFSKLPASIKDPPFEAAFDEDGNCIISRIEDRNGIKFDIGETLPLIEGTRILLQYETDRIRIDGVPIAGGGFTYTEPPFSGRT